MKYYEGVRLPEKKHSNSHGARPVYWIITMISWIRTSKLSTKNSLSMYKGLGCQNAGPWTCAPRKHQTLPESPSRPFRVQDLGSRFHDSRVRVWGFGLRCQVSGSRVQGLGFKVQGSGFRDQGSGFRVEGSSLMDRGSGKSDQGS